MKVALPYFAKSKPGPKTQTEDPESRTLNEDLSSKGSKYVHKNYHKDEIMLFYLFILFINRCMLNPHTLEVCEENKKELSTNHVAQL